MLLREASPDDAEDLAAVQNAIHSAGLRDAPVTVALVRERYLSPEYRVACTVAEVEGRVVGFQSLKRAWPGNPYGVPAGAVGEPVWGVIGTHVDPVAGRRGLGRRLFAVSHEAARAAGLTCIDAAIGTGNTGALAFYQSLGFVPYREAEGIIHHRFDL